MGWYYGHVLLLTDELAPRLLLKDPDMAAMLDYFQVSPCGRFFSFTREWRFAEQDITTCPLFVFDIDRWMLTAFWLEWGFHFEVLDFQPTAVIVRRVVDDPVIGTNSNPRTLAVKTWLPFTSLQEFMASPFAQQHEAD